MANKHRRERGGGADRRAPSEQPIDLDTIRPEDLNCQGEKWGQQLAKQVKTNQIRNIYSAVQHIRVRANQPNPDAADINRRLIFLKPKLAYASGRQRELNSLRDFLFKAIDSVVKSQNPERARENFFILMESIVAYHKFHGGRDS